MRPKGSTEGVQAVPFRPLSHGDATQTLLTVRIPTLAVLIGILVNNSRLNDLRAPMDARFNAVDRRFNDMEAVLTERLLRVE